MNRPTNPNSSPDLIQLHAADNVATALRDLEPGPVSVAEPSGGISALSLRQSLRLGHKAALDAIPEGALLVKHGFPFGRATAAIGAGEHVHIHNVISLSRETDRPDQGDQP